MAISAKDLYLIEKHLFGKLTDDEQVLFDKRMEDEEFAEEVAFNKCLKNACKLGGKKHCEKLRTSKKLNAQNRAHSKPPISFLGIFKILLFLFFIYTMFKCVIMKLF